MTRVVTPRGFGSPDVLELHEVDTPEPGPGELRLGVRAISVNPVDWYHYDGLHSDDPADLLTHGYELAGVVEAMGPGVDGVAVGDEVIATVVPGNGYADEAVVPAEGLIAKPARVSWEVAAFAVAHELGIKLIGGGPGADPGHAVRAVGRQEVLRLLEDGTIDIPIERTYSLADVADAHRASIAGHVRGKVVVVP